MFDNFRNIIQYFIYRIIIFLFFDSRWKFINNNNKNNNNNNNEIMFKQTRSLSNAACFKHENMSVHAQ